MNDLPMPTRGPVIVDCNEYDGMLRGAQYIVRHYEDGDNGVPPSCDGVCLVSPLEFTGDESYPPLKLVDGQLIAAAFNAATAAADMGFDPIGAVEALPKLLAVARKAHDGRAGCRKDAATALSAARTRGGAR